jgi:hypothetical protein
MIMETKGTLSNNYRDYEKVYLSPLQLELCNVEPYTSRSRRRGRRPFLEE